MAVKCEFEVGCDSIVLHTQANGDNIDIKRIHLGSENAANLALLINDEAKATLKVIIKKVGD